MSDEIVLPPIDVTDAERMAAKEWCGMIQKSRLMDGLVEVDSNFRCRERQLRASTARVIALERALRDALPAVEWAHKECTLTPNTPGEWWPWYEELQQARAALGDH